MKISNLRIGQKLVLTLALAIFTAFLIAGMVMKSIGKRYADETASSTAAIVNAQVVNMVDAYKDELESRPIASWGR